MSVINHAHTDLCPSCIINLLHCTFTTRSLHYTYSAPYFQRSILTLHYVHRTLTRTTLYLHCTNPWCMVYIIRCFHTVLSWATLRYTLRWCTLTLHHTRPHTTLHCTHKIPYQHWMDLHFIPTLLLISTMHCVHSALTRITLHSWGTVCRLYHPHIASSPLAFDS